MEVSRFERFIAMIGGEENLPPKLSQKVTETADLGTTQGSNSTQTPPASTSTVGISQKSDIEQEDDKSSCKTSPTRQPDVSSPPTMSTATTFDTRWGEPAPTVMRFVPFVAVTKFCYRFVSKELVQPLASAFFDQNKIYNRGWDIYFVNSDYTKLITFVPEHQLQALFHEINGAFPEANLTITDHLRQIGLILDFDGFCKELRPRWLGHSTSREQLSHMVHQTSLMPEMAFSTAPESDDRLEVWKQIMTTASEANKSKKKGKINQAQQHHRAVLAVQSEVDQLLRCQRYLGLLPCPDEQSALPNIARLTLKTCNESQPAIHPFNSDVIFIAIDIEASERPPHHVTEIGVAMLDTRDILGVAPGRVGTGWYKHIRSRHFRVREYQHYINHIFVQGCSEMFEFGTSEFVSKADSASTIASCFREPLGRNEHGALLVNEQASETKASTRNLVIVGHDLSSDVEYCKKMGFDVLGQDGILDTIDTASLDRAYTGKPQATSLGNILYFYDLTGWNLHNAGNDAVYTIRAMLATCVHAASQESLAEDGGSDGKDSVQPDQTVEEW